MTPPKFTCEQTTEPPCAVVREDAIEYGFIVSNRTNTYYKKGLMQQLFPSPEEGQT